jgi:putative ABC transport system ATP-binding protein
MVTHEPDMAAYARRMVHFVDGKIAKDAVNAHPVTGPVASDSTTDSTGLETT